MVCCELEKTQKCTYASTLRTIKAKLLNSLERTLSPRQEFCWRIIAAFCQAADISSTNLESIHNHLPIIISVGEICGKIGSRHRSNAEVAKCFEFLDKVRNILLTWRTNLEMHHITYDGMQQYASCYATDLVSVVDALPSDSKLLMELETLDSLQQEFRRQYEQLNILLIKYVPGHPEWCTLPSLLANFGINFSPDIHASISKYVKLPGKNATSSKQWKMLPNGCTGTFKLKMEDPLCISRDMTLKNLVVLNENISHFIQPISAYMEILIFFQLHTCRLFTSYLRVQYSQICKLNESVKPPIQSVLNPFPLPVLKTDCPGLECLLEAASNSKKMLYQLLDGTAKYSDITSGINDLTEVDVVNEVKVLGTFFALYEPQMNQDELFHIIDILQLLKASMNVQRIQDVCIQYQLRGCLEDPQLKELISIADGANNRKADLTPKTASQKLRMLCSILCLPTTSTFACFNLFSAAANSAEFHKFIMEKKFVGAKGRQAFQQQYQLLTAQLQHEQYNDTVLNHLYAAYELILIFTNPDQTLHDLMSAIAMIKDICAGLKHLETANTNISQIYLWFSSTEVCAF